MMKLLQIDACLNSGSTGRITEDIAKTALRRGWECYHIHGSRYVNPPSVMRHFQPGCKMDEYLHYIEHYFFDNDGLASRKSTKQAIEIIKEINPDIIQLHDIHDHWLNYRILFEYLNTLETPIVWTQHDCWSFTGDCGHFGRFSCNQWETKCTRDCPARKNNPFRRVINHGDAHYNLKKQLFSNTKDLTLVPVSHWLEGLLKKSFLSGKNIKTIYNGIDLDIFKPTPSNQVRKKYGIGSNRYVVGVATAWSERKGLLDYFKLTSLLKDNWLVVLVGLEGGKAEEAKRAGVLTIPRTDNVQELVAIYSGSDVVLNLSYEETFGLTSVEGFACGKPTIVYNCTASPELVGNVQVGRVVEPGDILGVKKALEELMNQDQTHLSDICRLYAAKSYNKDDIYNQYFELYKRLLKL